MNKPIYKLCYWEDNEYIIERNGLPFGCTLTKTQGDILIKWLEVYGL